MIQTIRNFFSSEDFMPHGHCFLWQPNILWLHVLSDATIAAAYFSIPFALMYILRKRRDSPFQNIFFLFAAFILLCGLTHIFSIWVLWNPDYAAEGVVKALTAFASIATFIVIVHLIPRIVGIPSNAQLLQVNQQLEEAHLKLEKLYHENKTETESYLRGVVSTIIDGFIIIESTGVIQTFNPAAERIFGYTAAEVIGQNIKMLMPEPYQSGHDGYLHHYQKTGGAKIIGTSGREVSGRRKDGSIFPLELSVSAFALENGQHYCGIVRDITTRKKSEEQNSLLAAIVTSSEDAIISRTLTGTILSWNAGAERLFGYSAQEAIGQYISLIIPPEKIDEEKEIIEQVHAGHSVEHYQTERVDRNGKRIPISLTVSPVRDKTGHIIGASKIIHDITDQKRSEAELLRYSMILERSNQELDDFAYIASHDLKEPLRGLSNNAGFLKEDCGDRLDAQNIKRLDRMMYLCERMERLVNDLLYFSRLGRQELAIQQTDLNEVIKDIESMMENTLHEANVTIHIDGTLPPITCDLPRITEVFRNLITNAVKYNDKPEKNINIGCIQKDVERVFYVRDNGIGIAPQFYQDVFRIFKRLNEEDDNVKGTGVGLTFVKKIIERHSGRIWIESELGVGTSFYFTINQPQGVDL